MQGHAINGKGQSWVWHSSLQTSSWVFRSTTLGLKIPKPTIGNLCYLERKNKKEDNNSSSLLGSNTLNDSKSQAILFRIEITPKIQSLWR